MGSQGKIAEIEAQMGILVDKAQGAIIKDRSIIGNVLVCQGLVRCCHKDAGAPFALYAFYYWYDTRMAAVWIC